MKAFVIKENELYSRNKTDFVKYLFAAKIFLSKEDAENYKKDISDNENCEVVEITIAEGDLEHENEILKRALKLACQTIKEIMPTRPLYICGEAIAERLGIPMTSEIKDYDYFIEQAKENKDET